MISKFEKLFKIHRDCGGNISLQWSHLSSKNILMHSNAIVNIRIKKPGSSWCIDNHIMHVNYIAIDGCR